MKLSEFDYHLPKSLIAQKPTRPRDHSRLLVIRRGKKRFRHHKFHEIGKYLQAGDVLVLNDSKVIPARLFGRKSTGGKVEILLLKKITDGRWQALIKNLTTLQVVKLNDEPTFTAQPIKKLEGGLWEIKFDLKGKKFEEIISKIGKPPVPPYIKHRVMAKEYQTVYAKHAGSVAAPTAGLHFTRRLINKLKKRGVEILFITLHIGLGTFQPIKSDDVRNHKIHSEFAEVPIKTAERINRAKKEGCRIIAVGTTVCRTLEAFTDEHGIVKAGQREVDLFILPGYKFKTISGLITNFHLPKTTLLLLVAAFMGRKLLRRAYRKAIKRKYRFYSFGDAMLII